MTQPLPEPRHFNPQGGQDPENSQNLLEDRRGIVAVVATHEAHVSGWAAEATVGLAEASQRAGHPAAVFDLAVDSPRLHEAAGVEQGEGLTDLVVFGASLNRVSNTMDSGVRVVTAGTPIAQESELWTAPGDDDEGASEPSWVEAARELADDGCALLYLVADSAGLGAILDVAQDVILIRHEGDSSATLPVRPSLVLEPQPAASINAEILPAPALDDEVPEDLEIADDADTLAPSLEEGEAVEEGVEEVVLDLDDVIDDSPLHDTILTADTEVPADDLPEDVADVDVSGLEVAPEWPAFQEPLEMQEPGSLDPIVTASGEPESVTPDMGLDDIVGGESGLTIVSDELGVPEEHAGGPDLGHSVPDPSRVSDTVDGLIDGAQDTLSRAGEVGLPSADQVTGLDDGTMASPLHDPSGWGPPPSASDNAPTASDLALDDLTPGSGEAGPESGPPSFAGPPSERLGIEPPAEAGRPEDPWGEPPKPPEPADAEPSPLETVSRADEAAPQPESFPWEERVEEKAGAVAKEPEVPVADVTRTRRRNRSNGPRPLLLVLFLLLIITVGVLWWVELLDVPLLDGLRGGAP